MAIAAAAIIGGATLASGAIGAGASKKAASQQADANTHAADLVFQMYQQTAARLKPWVDTGSAALGQLGSFLGLPGSPAVATGGFGPGAGVQPFNLDINALKDPNNLAGQQFQFIDKTGREATTNAAAAMGLGKSGSLLKGIDAFTTGLASTTYQQQFNNYWAQLSQVYNMLSGTSVVGENAAAQTGQAGTSVAATGGAFTSAAGQNLGAGTLNAAGAVTNSLGGVSQLPLQLALLNQVQGGTGGSNFGSLFSNSLPVNSPRSDPSIT